jgi:hypothetical protein
MITQRTNNPKQAKSKSQVLAHPPHIFDWKLFKKVAKVDAIKNESTAKNHFMEHAHMNTHLRNDYFRALLKIPDYFDEELYVDFLQNEYSVKMKKGEINNDSLYTFYANKGKKTYPLKDVYFKTYYQIPKEFDEELYKQIYQYSSKKETFNNELKKYENVYQFYNENSVKFPINHDYLKMYYNTPDEFDYDLYKNVYNLNVVEISKKSNLELENSEIYKKLHIYNHYKNNINFLNDSTYFKKYYHIPDNFDEEIYNNQYPNVKQNLTNVKNMQEKYERLNKIIIKNQANVINKIIEAEVKANIKAQPIKAQPINAQPTNAQPTNAQPTNAQPTNAQPINAQPINAQPQSQFRENALQLQMPVLQLLFPKIKDINEFFTIENKRCDAIIEQEILHKALNEDLYILNNLIDYDIIFRSNLFLDNFISRKIELNYILNVYNHHMNEDNIKYQTLKKHVDYTNTFKLDITSEKKLRYFFRLNDYYKDIFENEDCKSNNYNGITIDESIHTKMTENNRHIIAHAREHSIIYDLFVEENKMNNDLKNLGKCFYEDSKYYDKHTIYIDFVIPDNKLYHELIIKKNILNVIKYHSGTILNIKIYSDNNIDIHKFYNIGVKKIYPLDNLKKNNENHLGNNIHLIMGTNYMIVNTIQKHNYIIKNNKQSFQLIVDNMKKNKVEKPIFLEELFS